jgi:hypothetical protein
MNIISRAAALAAASTLLVSMTPFTASAAPCSTRLEAREAIAEMRADIREEVKSPEARADVANAVHAVIETFRAPGTQDAEERQNLGRQISAVLRELRNEDTLVEKKALGLQVKALRNDRERGKFTAGERKTVMAAFAALKAALLSKAGNRAERAELARDIRTVRSQIVC